MNCELMLTLWYPRIYICMFNVYKNQLSRQSGSRDLTGLKTLPTIWSLWPNIRFLPSIVAEKNILGRTGRGKTVYPLRWSGGIINSITNDRTLQMIAKSREVFRTDVFACFFNDNRCKVLIYINVREHRRDNQKWTLQRNWKHRVLKTKKTKTKTQQKMCWKPPHVNKHK